MGKIALSVSLVVLAAALAPSAGGRPVAATGVAVGQLEDALELVGQYGGWSVGVDAVGNTAYLAHANRLLVYDVTDRTAPRQIVQGRPLPGLIDDLVVVDDVGYVTLLTHHAWTTEPEQAGTVFAVVDVEALDSTDPLSYVELPGSRGQMAIDGHHAFIANGLAGLVIVDVANPAAARVVATLSTRERTLDVAVVDGVAYLADNGGLRVIDVTDPTKPLEVVSVPDSTEVATRLAVANGYAYLAGSRGVVVLDVRDPTSPQEATVVGSSTELDIAVNGQYVYATDFSGSGALNVYDVSEPGAPRAVARLPGSVSDLHFVADTAYAFISQEGMRILDVADPTTPTVVAEVDRPPAVDDVVIYGAYGYAATGSDSMTVLDVSRPESPLAKGTVDARAIGIHVADGYAYSSHGYWSSDIGGNLEIIDVQNSEAPQVVASIGPPIGVESTGDPFFASVDSASRHLFTLICDATSAGRGTSTEFEFHVYDLADRTNPRHVGALPALGSDCTDLDVSGGYAYAACGSLTIIDVTDPARPQLISTTLSRPSSRGIQALDGYAYVASGDYHEPGLEVFDVRDPAAAHSVGWVGLQDEARDVMVAGDFAFVAAFSAGLQVIDVSDPSSPQVKSALNTSRPAQHVQVAGRHVYVATGVGGLLVWRMTDALMPHSAFMPIAHRP